jgi:D-glycero-D-manno-heptose 1,7-bisphosphate phosphatase
VSESRAAVFLDRDGVLNRAIVREGKPFSPMSFEEFELLAGVEDACADLVVEGRVLVVLTNQPEIARGKLDTKIVERMHAELFRRLPLLDVLVCGHDNADDCVCRKPKPGMILEAAVRHGLDLTRSVMVGDRASDIAAGRAAGCSTIRIGHGYSGEALGQEADATATSLHAALQVILQLTK